jgi:hypothetical protein
MPCIVCHQPLKDLGVTGRRVEWCANCGAIYEAGLEEEKTQAPKLVERCLKLIAIYNRCVNTGLPVTIPGELIDQLKESVGRKP